MLRECVDEVHEDEAQDQRYANPCMRVMAFPVIFVVACRILSKVIVIYNAVSVVTQFIRVVGSVEAIVWSSSECGICIIILQW